MIIAIIAYFVSFFCVKTIKKQNFFKYKKFPQIKMRKGGLVFNSFKEHRLKVENEKIMGIGNILYLNLSGSLVIVSNVTNVKKCGNYLYFKCLGQVEIYFNCESYYRFFLIDVKSSQFNLREIKQLALRDLMNNGFDLNFAKIAQKYIKILKNVLNIHVFSNKIVVKSNKFKLSYTLTYKLNNVIKHIVVNERI